MQRLEEEQRAAAEAEARDWEAMRHQREVQLLLERSAELRELKGKLQAAEVNLGRVQQREQRAAIEEREREYSAALEALMAQQREAAAAHEVAQAAARARVEEEARQALSQQMEERTQLQLVARVGPSRRLPCRLGLAGEACRDVRRWLACDQPVWVAVFGCVVCAGGV